MRRRDFLSKLIQLIMAGSIALLPSPIKASACCLKQTPKRLEYNVADIAKVKEFISVLAQAVADKKIRYYSCEFRKIDNTIVFLWGD